MRTLEDVAAIAEEETAALPSYVYDELNGGVVVDPNACLHPARLEDDLYILGTYSSSPVMGKQIVLYYGSFTASLGNAGEAVYREQIRETIRHEFRHHLETRAGLFGAGTLVEEDKEKMLTYFMRHAR